MLKVRRLKFEELLSYPKEGPLRLQKRSQAELKLQLLL
jgi:hypothetical protein